MRFFGRFFKGNGMPDQETKYVVLHSLIGGEYHRGQVVAGSQLQGATQRFLDLKAVREATEAEALCDVVDVDATRPRASVQQLMAEQEQENKRLQERVTAQNQQIADLQVQLAKATKPSPATVADSATSTDAQTATAEPTTNKPATTTKGNK
jgi:hypothetical protein